ncbi:MAG: lactonase family protein [Spirochaetota bacterium]
MTYIFYIGTYTRKEDHVDGKAEGIYIYSFDAETLRFTRLHARTGIVNPSFLALSKDRRHLFAVSETDTFRSSESAPLTGAVASYRIHHDDNTLELINTVCSEGTYPCHLTVDTTGTFLYAANYISGSIAMFPVGRDGRLRKASSVVRHEGSSVNPDRQEGPHAHSVNLVPGELCLVAADLGLDKLFVYPVDMRAAALTPPVCTVELTPGSGPRHFAFHPSGRYAYCVNELSSTVTVFTYNPNTCELDAFQEVSSLPLGFSGESAAADIHLHPDGTYLYASNRGHDSIAIFRVDPITGKLEFLRAESTRGKTPRNFALSPDGHYLFAANQDSGSISTYRIDADSGMLGYLATEDVPTPVCLVITTPEL